MRNVFVLSIGVPSVAHRQFATRRDETIRVDHAKAEETWNIFSHDNIEHHRDLW